MANKRIKDIANEATFSTLDSNQYAVVDGSTGTFKTKLSAISDWIHGRWASFVNALTAKTSFASGDKIAVVNGSTATAMDASLFGTKRGHYENESKIDSLDGVNFISGFWPVSSSTTTAPTTRSANAYISSVRLYLKNGEKVLITASGTSAAKAWSFYDTDGNVVAIAPSDNYYKYEYTTPSDGLLLVNSQNSRPSDVEVYSYTRELAEHNNDATRSVFQDGLEWVTGLIQIASSTTTMPATCGTTSDWRFIKIKVKAGEKYEWRGTGSNIAIPYMLFDVSGNTLSYGASTTPNSTYIIDVTADGWLICNSLNVSKHYLKRVAYTEDINAEILSDKVTAIYNEFEWASGFWSVSSSTTTQPLVRSNNSLFVSAKLYLKKGESCVLSGVGTSVALPWSFYDVDKNIVSYSTGLNYYKYIFVAPSDGVLLINALVSRHYGVYIPCYTRETAERNEQSVQSMLNGTITWETGFIVMYSDVSTLPYEGSNNTDYRFIKMPVKAGDRYHYVGTGASAALPYALFDVNGDLVEVNTSTARIFVDIDVSQDGWIVCNSTKISPHVLCRISTQEDAPTNDENPTANPMMAFNNIVCIGDSLTASQVWTGSTPADHRRAYKTYPEILGKICDADVETLAQSGDTTIMSWNRYKDSITSKTNALAIVYLGTNGGLTDTLDTDAPESDDPSTWADTNTGCYAKWVNKLQTLGYKVLLIKPYATGADIYVTKKVIDKVASRFGCAVVGPVFTDDLKYHYYPDLSGSNGLHFNDLGYAWFASVLVNKVSALDTDSLKYIIPV